MSRSDVAVAREVACASEEAVTLDWRREPSFNWLAHLPARLLRQISFVSGSASSTCFFYMLGLKELRLREFKTTLTLLRLIAAAAIIGIWSSIPAPPAYGMSTPAAMGIAITL